MCAFRLFFFNEVLYTLLHSPKRYIFGINMPYCHHYLKIHNPEHLDCAVRLLAKEQFDTRDAYPLDNPNHFNIDSSTNDVRANVDIYDTLIRLICRYKKDVQRMSQRIIKFADSHPVMCGVVDEEDTGGVDEMAITMTWKE
jgi:hypothetical protein